jgi:hypothetical protein
MTWVAQNEDAMDYNAYFLYSRDLGPPDTSGSFIPWWPDTRVPPDWDFGDGYSDTKKDTSHTYTRTGSYNASFTVTDNNGCIETFNSTVGTIETPVANFAIDSLIMVNDTVEGYIPLDLTIFDLSAYNSQVEYIWGDGDVTEIPAGLPTHRIHRDTQWAVPASHTSAKSGGRSCCALEAATPRRLQASETGPYSAIPSSPPAFATDAAR